MGSSKPTAAVILFALSIRLCSGGKCGFPGKPVFATVSPNQREYREGTGVTYTCLRGRVLFGHVFRRCLYDGTWSGSLPVCAAKADLDGAIFNAPSPTAYLYHTRLSDDNPTTCFSLDTQDRRWIRISLQEDIYRVLGLTITGSNRPSLVTVNITGGEQPAVCGSLIHELDRFSTKMVTCQEDGVVGKHIEINHQVPEERIFSICEVAIYVLSGKDSCGDAEWPKYSSISVSAPNDKKKIIYECRKGYRLMGDNTRTCHLGVWSGSAPYCEKITCIPPATVEDANYTIDYLDDGEAVLGTTVTYVCPLDSILSGNTTLRCGEEGIWEGILPTCTPLSAIYASREADVMSYVWGIGVALFTGVLFVNCILLILCFKCAPVKQKSLHPSEYKKSIKPEVTARVTASDEMKTDLKKYKNDTFYI